MHFWELQKACVEIVVSFSSLFFGLYILFTELFMDPREHRTALGTYEGKQLYCQAFVLWFSDLYSGHLNI